MREIKFRARAKYTKNLQFEYAYKKQQEKFTGHFDDYKKNGNKNGYDNYDEWYDAQDVYFDKVKKEYKGEEKSIEYKMITGDKFNINGNGNICKNYGYADLKVMQYTGLKDKNGKEIYEGDIFKNNKGYNSLILWSVGTDMHNNGFYGYYGKWYGDDILDTKSYGKIDYLDNSIEVIGNIYETPNLLKEGK